MEGGLSGKLTGEVVAEGARKREAREAEVAEVSG